MAVTEAAGSRRYLVLGPVEARLDGRVLPVAPGKQTLLLAALLARPDRVVPVDTLVDTLWGGRSPTGAAGSLRALVSKLRRALGGGDAPVDTHPHGLLMSAAGGYRLCLPASEAGRRAQELLDAWGFASLLAQARAARLAGQAAAAVDAYRAALGLWRGAAFTGATGQDPVSVLVTGEARRLDIERAEGIQERLAAELDLGRHAQLLGELEALVTAEPLHERPRELLMVALYRTGRQQDALAVYRRLRTLLAEEFGVEPSAHVRSLHKRILQQDPTLVPIPPGITQQPAGKSRVPPTAAGTFSDSGPVGAPGGGTEAAGTPSPDLPVGNLPFKLGGLVGRDVTLAQTLEILRVSRMVTLTGTAGVGKTTLAIHAAAAAVRSPPEGREGTRAGFDDGAWLVELAPVADGNSVVDAVSSVLGVQQRPGKAGVGRLVEYLRPKRLLLVVDNCEHVIDATAELVAAVVRGCAHIVVLATSREPLGVDGEQVRLVPPLAVPPPSFVDAGVRLVAAAALFLARAQAAAPGFALTDSNAAAVGEICRRLDGVPLAIELAATRMRSLSPSEVVDRLEQRFRLLRGGPRTAGMRHRTLQAAIEWSHGLLAEDERRVFDRLSVFAGGFALEAAERIAADADTTTGGPGQPWPIDETAVAALLTGLVDKSMVVAEPGDGSTRYTLLETLRAYGREHLAARGEEHATRRTHATYLAASVEAAARHLERPDSLRFAEAIAQQLDDLRAAHAWALAHDLSVAVWLVAGLFRYVEHRLSPEVPIWAERTIEAAEVARIRQSSLLPTVYAIAARGAARRGDLGRAKVLAERGTTAGVGPTDPARRHPLYALSAVALFEGRLRDAGRLTAQVEQLSLAANDAWFTVRAQTIRSLAHVYAGDLPAALAVADHARALADRSGDPAATGWSRYATGEALLETNPDRAAVLLEEALAAARAVDDRYLTGVAMVSATSVRARHGDARQAALLFLDVIQQWHAGGNWTQQWTTIRNVVELLMRTGRHAPAAVLLGALDQSGTAPPAFGTGGARLAAARRALADHLGPDAFAVETARGEAMGDDQALRFTRRTLGRMAQHAQPPRLAEFH